MSAAVARVVTPGTLLGSADALVSGAGTYVLNGHVFASTVGAVQEIKGEEDAKPTISVQRERSDAQVPGIGNIVLCKVTKINMRMAYADILTVEDGKPFRGSFPGVIRLRDVRAFDVDSVEIYNSFRPGDVVRALVLSLGDAKSYYLSTARNDLGVVAAQGRGGQPMVPLSWEVMQCPVTRVKEYRKVAKIEQAE